VLVIEAVKLGTKNTTMRQSQM